MAPDTSPDQIESIFASTLLDASGQPNLYVKSSQNHNLVWRLVNNQNQELVVTPFDSSKVDENQYHFRFDFTPGALTNPPAVKDWNVYVVKDEKGGIKSLYVALQGSKPLSLGPGAHKETTLAYTQAIQEDPNNSKVAVHLTTGTRVTLGGTAIPNKTVGPFDLTLVKDNAPTLSAPPLAVDFVGRRTVLNDGKTANSFTFALTNMTQADLTLSPSGAPTIFTVWFDAAPNEGGQGYPWALARVGDLDSEDFVLPPPSVDWSVKKTVSTSKNVVVSPRWAITVLKTVVLKPQDPVLFTFKGLKTNLDPGITRMYLRFENLGDFVPGVLIAELEKNPLVYGANIGQGLYVSAGVPKINPTLTFDSGLYVQQFGTGAAAIFNGGNAIFNGGKVGIGTEANQPAAKLQIQDANQSPEGGSVIIGSGPADPGLRFGCQSGYAWIQSHTSKPLAINPLPRNVGIGTVKPSAMLQVNDTALKEKIFDEITTVGIVQRATDTAGLSIRKFDANAVLQFCVYEPSGKTGWCNYIQAEKGTAALLIGEKDQLRVTTDGKVTAANLTVTNLTATNTTATSLTAASLAMTGNLTISGKDKAKNAVEFGAGYPGKEVSAGKVGYGIFSDALDIVGGGDKAGSRRVCVWEHLALMAGGDSNVKTVLELGYGYPNKQQDAGKIAYKAFSPGLDIVGATSDISNRQIHLWDEVYVRGTLWLLSGGYWCRMAPNKTVAPGDWEWAKYISSSDVRLKQNVTPIEASLDKVRKLSGYTYHWTEDALNHFTKGIDTLQPENFDLTAEEIKAVRQAEREKQKKILGQPQVGVIAQEVEAVLPQAVTTDDDGYKSISYKELIALLIEAIKEQDRAVAAQAALLARQQTEIQQLKQAVKL